MSEQLEDLKIKALQLREKIIEKKRRIEEVQNQRLLLISQYTESGREIHSSLNVSLWFEPFGRHTFDCKCHREGDTYLLDQFDFKMTSFELEINEIQSQTKKTKLGLRRLQYRMRKINTKQK